MAMEGSTEPQPRKGVPTSTGPSSRRYVDNPGATLGPGSVNVNPALAATLISGTGVAGGSNGGNGST